MTDVQLIMKSHRCGEAAAKQILADLESGKRVPVSSAELRKKAGLGPGDLRKSTKPISQLFGDSLDSLDRPRREAGRRDNGRKPVCGDRAVRGFERGED